MCNLGVLQNQRLTVYHEHKLSPDSAKYSPCTVHITHLYVHFSHALTLSEYKQFPSRNMYPLLLKGQLCP